MIRAPYLLQHLKSVNIIPIWYEIYTLFFTVLLFGSLCLDKESQNPNIACASFYSGNLSKGILGIQILLVGLE